MPRLTLVAAALVLLYPQTASAQLTAAKDAPIVYGHHHLAVSDVDAAKKFWVDTLGGTFITLNSGTQAIRYPGVFILLRAQAPKGGSKGTTVNHLGFSVPDLAKALDRIRSGGYRIVTREEAIGPREIANDIAITTGGTSIAFVMAPDDVKVELVENRSQTTPVALHHVHFFGTQPAEMQAWYAKVFGATARPGSAQLVSATLPGVMLNFSPSDTPVAGTAGRAVDHIGFEVKNLEAFTKQLQAAGVTLNVSYRQVPKTDMFIAFITDPWGTSIELSEGLANIP
jgi:catechol 2,3-dioxygenase-like lactoylglutathione lyase family enzyme